jgi:hypothetical protein
MLAALVYSCSILAQPAPGVYLGTDAEKPYLFHEVKINNNYIIHSVYKPLPMGYGFIQTSGGYYTAKADSLQIDFEFNSNFANDSIRQALYGYSMYGDTLILKTPSILVFIPAQKKKQDLDGTWLFATRGPDTGQERRGNESPRKTLKFLQDGYFQWIAYNTETMQFSGTGGGRFTAIDGNYTETITYFSRDNSRVGAMLDFQYDLQGKDWHHKGENSRGESMYEIWARRE